MLSYSHLPWCDVGECSLLVSRGKLPVCIQGHVATNVIHIFRWLCGSFSLRPCLRLMSQSYAATWTDLDRPCYGYLTQTSTALISRAAFHSIFLSLLGISASAKMTEFLVGSATCCYDSQREGENPRISAEIRAIFGRFGPCIRPGRHQKGSSHVVVFFRNFKLSKASFGRRSDPRT